MPPVETVFCRVSHDERVQAALLALLLVAAPLAFIDAFEIGPAWGIFEEIVGGNPCYGEGLARVEASPEAALGTGRGLVVEANAPLSSSSNHVIAQQRLPYADVGRIAYTVAARAPSDAALEAGPEKSVQLTRAIPGGHETLIAGVQFVQNPWAAPSWNVWREVAPGVAAWRSVHTAPLARDVWHQVTLTADLEAARYGSLTVVGPDTMRVIDLSDVPIARETRFHEPALWLTLEAENLWTNCGDALPSRGAVHYDDVRFIAARSG